MTLNFPFDEEPRGEHPRDVRRAELRRRRRRWAWLATGLVVAVLLVLGVSAVLVLLDARRAEASLRDAIPTVQRLQSSVRGGETAEVEPAMAELQAQTAVAHSATRGPHWWVAGHVPVVGESVVAVQTVASVVDSMATDALPSLAEAARLIDPAVMIPQQGRIDTQPFIDVAPRVIAADDAVQAGSARLDMIDEEEVVAQVAGPVSEVKEMMAEVVATTGLASKAAQLVPPMLGAYGERSYAILAQSPAEIRATGGHPGAVMLLTADQGELSLGERVGGGELFSETPVVPLTPQEELLFSDRLVTYGVDATLTPDFPRTAEITRAQWLAAFGAQVDGVMAVDPVALGYFLEATGPVQTDDGTVLNSENAASLLLNGIYLDPERSMEGQDEFFGQAAEAVFDALTEGNLDTGKALQALTRAAEEGRWLMWSSDPREQDIVSGTSLSGELAGERDGAPVVGVYLNDASATKMSYYLDYSVTVNGLGCVADGVRRLSTTVDIASTAPPEAVGFPPYLAGQGQIMPGHAVTNVLVYSPAWGRIDSVTVDGEEYPFMGLYTHEEMDVAQVTIDLGPGESRQIVVDMQTGGEGQDEVTEISLTPGPRNADQNVQESSTC